MLELHCHTTYSDGTLAPEPLVAQAAQAGVRALAITDHDTLAGWSEAIAAKLAALGYPIALPEPRPGLAPARPHLAQALVAAGYAASSREAFERWLHDGGPAYVPYEKFSAVEGIQLLRACGAVVVWAHPHLFRGGAVAAVLPELVAAGLQGVEVYHPSHGAAAIAALEAFSQEYGLLRTGGSDYDGPSAQGVEETRLNQAQLPLELLAAVQAVRDGYSPIIS